MPDVPMITPRISLNSAMRSISSTICATGALRGRVANALSLSGARPHISMKSSLTLRALAAASLEGTQSSHGLGRLRMDMSMPWVRMKSSFSSMSQYSLPMGLPREVEGASSSDGRITRRSWVGLGASGYERM
jgi:hypothetical protein